VVTVIGEGGVLVGGGEGQDSTVCPGEGDALGLSRWKSSGACGTGEPGLLGLPRCSGEERGKRFGGVWGGSCTV